MADVKQAENFGFSLTALFIGAEPRKNNDGYNILCAVGVESFRVKVQQIPRPYQLGECITFFPVSASSFKDKVYYSGYIL